LPYKKKKKKKTNGLRRKGSKLTKKKKKEHRKVLGKGGGHLKEAFIWKKRTRLSLLKKAFFCLFGGRGGGKANVSCRGKGRE